MFSNRFKIEIATLCNDFYGPLYLIQKYIKTAGLWFYIVNKHFILLLFFVLFHFL